MDLGLAIFSHGFSLDKFVGKAINSLFHLSNQFLKLFYLLIGHLFLCDFLARAISLLFEVILQAGDLVPK
jgi:hypothetical protein